MPHAHPDLYDRYSTGFDMREHIAVIGLGYVGLPLALALAKKFTGTIGFDIDINRVEGLQKSIDKNG